MTLKRCVFTRDFKLQVIREVEAGKSHRVTPSPRIVGQNLRLPDNSVVCPIIRPESVIVGQSPPMALPKNPKSLSTYWAGEEVFGQAFRKDFADGKGS